MKTNSFCSLIISCILCSCSNGPEIQKVVSTDLSVQLDALCFTSESEGVLFASDKYKIMIWETNDAGDSWQEKTDCYGYRFYDHRRYHAIYSVGNKIFGLVEPQVGSPSVFVYDNNTEHWSVFEIPYNLNPGLQWVLNDEFHFYISDSDVSYEVIVDTLGQMECRPATRDLTKLKEIIGSGNCEYWIMYDKDSLYYQVGNVTSTLPVTSPEHLAMMGDISICATQEREGCWLILAGNTQDKSVDSIYEVNEYQSVRKILTYSDNIVLLVSNINGVWGTACDIIYSTDGGKKWRKKRIGLQIECSYLVGDTFYFSTNIGGLYRIRLKK